MRRLALDRIEAALREILESGETFPTARAFCRRHGISSRTFCAARARLVAQGESLPGPGPQSLAEEVAATLAQELADGHFPLHTPLPSPKELAAARGLHPVTVRRALAGLVEEGVLERRGRRWFPHRPTLPATAQPLVLCIGGGTPEEGVRMEGDREIDAWREVQAEASAAGLALHMVPWDGQLGNLPPGSLGAVVSTWHLADPQALLRELVARRLRCCVFTGSALDRATRDWKGERLLSFHDIGDSRAAGRDMARHLAELGHRKIAWLSPFHGSRWSRNRLEGLRQAFPGAVESFVLSAVSEGDFMPSPESTIARWEASFEALGQWSLSPAHPLWEAFKTLALGRLMEAFAPQLEAALGSGATAWVGASDLVAGLCHRFLSRRSIAVPGDLSLCGFDDTSLSMREELTSYRFDTATMAREMIGSLLSGRPGKGRRTSHPGRVVVRTSTSAPAHEPHDT